MEVMFAVLLGFNLSGLISSYKADDFIGVMASAMVVWMLTNSLNDLYHKGRIRK